MKKLIFKTGEIWTVRQIAEYLIRNYKFEYYDFTDLMEMIRNELYIRFCNNDIAFKIDKEDAEKLNLFIDSLINKE